MNPWFLFFGAITLLFLQKVVPELDPDPYTAAAFALLWIWSAVVAENQNKRKGGK